MLEYHMGARSSSTLLEEVCSKLISTLALDLRMTPMPFDLGSAITTLLQGI